MVILRPLAAEIGQPGRSGILKHRSAVLSKVIYFIGAAFNPDREEGCDPHLTIDC